MNNKFSKIHDFLNCSKCLLKNDLLKNIFQNLQFLNISNISSLGEKEKQNFNEKLKESKVIIIKQITETEKNYIFGFEKTLIIDEHSTLTTSFLNEIYEINPKISVCILPGQNNYDNQQIDIPDKFHRINFDENFKEEINKFSYFLRCKLFLSHPEKTMRKILEIINS